jgi:hypothetical protein
MDKIPIEITAILREIERAIDAKLYYLAIAVALSVPDICGCLEFDPKSRKTSNIKTYAPWCDDNIGPRFANLSGTDLWYMRCGVVHSGTFAHHKVPFGRVIFLTPDFSQFKAHDVILTVAPGIEFGGISVETLHVSGKILYMDVLKFCNTIMECARTWAIAKADDPFVQQNLPNLIRYRPEGLPPFMVGVPIIA